MEEVNIGEFARLSRVSPKALRLYDETGLLRPARVDADSGYRYYEPDQLEAARLVSALRQLQQEAFVALGPSHAVSGAEWQLS